MENLTVEQLQEAHRPFRRQTVPEIRANLKRLGYDWRGGLPRAEVETYTRRFVYNRHQEDFAAQFEQPEPEPKAKKAPRKKRPRARKRPRPSNGPLWH